MREHLSGEFAIIGMIFHDKNLDAAEGRTSEACQVSSSFRAPDVIGYSWPHSRITRRDL